MIIIKNNMKNAKVILLGADGTLGQALSAALTDWNVTRLTSADIDVTQEDSIKRVLEPLLSGEEPCVLINATAVNAVDKITTEPQMNALAYAVNGTGPGMLAAIALRHNVRFVHFSTDYVFDGKARTPYTEDAAPNPQSEYAKSKRAGEVSSLQHNPHAIVIRTSRLFGAPGASAMSKKSFVDIVKQLAAAGKPAEFVDEEIAGPTFVVDLAAFTRLLIEQDVPGGIYHGTNSGQCTWFQFAQEILKQIQSNLPITAVPGTRFPRPAARPAYSVLVCTKVTPMRSWQEALADYLAVTA